MTKSEIRDKQISLNFIRLLRVVITPSVRGENDSKQSDEFQANKQICLLSIMFKVASSRDQL